ncbi:hypothetical protein NEPAR06_0069 [Nematocida parisii]|uniref:Uncharacterized protein n=1 Tax=Nematocida parisii (strain ERTm3) TaxID=935791 RepID=I3EE38_NEMP3|nr:uncharacterized protein NEPG_00087 [Nematocida parisii ERTm1]EIJ87485.1 hypothetical protein NEQG_02366 [Nematocida parisii ERTm3]KAI5142759.1 hypothetical protein NEPAR07_0285 [Nematocida parisii]EIJ94565.1 hypothetical protein NEPG_00087 [Nematocida parisii ERTm1]KAI5152948.1 hypothetical protein NEPAR06_0069 [Nematocida parisii]KAI5157294.1 hypothetical protein NEPAR05_1159 [Nematocida parisii]|eukprot:XP_013057921.1 hypothetical protein NEPG_00087 [Nematocida parisii ERTm1]
MHIRTMVSLFVISCLIGIGILIATNPDSGEKSDKPIMSSSTDSIPSCGYESADLQLQNNDNPLKIGQDNSIKNTHAETERNLAKTENLSPSVYNMELGFPVLETPKAVPIRMPCNPTQNIPENANKEVEEIPVIENKMGKVSKPNKSYDISPAIPFTAEETELLEALKNISRKNKLLPKITNYSNVMIINETLKYKNTVVIKSTKHSGTIENKTLWEVIHAYNNEEFIDIYSEQINPIVDISLLYPTPMLAIPVIKHTLLAYCTPQKICNIALSLDGFNFEPNEHIVDEYDVFFSARKLVISKSSICINELNLLSAFYGITDLSFVVVTILSSDIKMDLCLPEKLEKLKICGIKREHVNFLLCGINSCHGLKEIEVSYIDFMDTAGLNSIEPLNRITSFTLKNIVFSGSPDFEFLKKMQALQELTMSSIFYSYTEQFKVENLDKIKQTPMYLNPMPSPECLPNSGAKEVFYDIDIVERNKTVGEHISPINIRVDSRLYKDLGLKKIDPEMKHKYKIHVMFTKKIEHT